MCQFCSVGPSSQHDSTDLRFAGFFSADAIEAAIRQASRRNTRNRGETNTNTPNSYDSSCVINDNNSNDDDNGGSVSRSRSGDEDDDDGGGGGEVEDDGT